MYLTSVYVNGETSARRLDHIYGASVIHGHICESVNKAQYLLSQMCTSMCVVCDLVKTFSSQV